MRGHNTMQGYTVLDNKRRFTVFAMCIPMFECVTRSTSCRWLVSLFISALSANLSAQSVVLTSAASYEPVVAPDSLATVFGHALTDKVLSTSLDPEGNLPTEAGGVSVEVDGKKAGIIFVSPGQINIWIPPSVRVGDVPFVVRGADGAVLGRGTAIVRDFAPALFSLDSTGRGPAAAQNAVTFSLAPFFVRTPENPGPDKRTRLTLYGTGFRFAAPPGQRTSGANVAAFLKATLYKHENLSYDLQVEYAGPAPRFFGLDQINVVLTEELDGMGSATVIVSSQGQASNAVSIEVWSTKRPQVLSVHPSSASFGAPLVIRGTNFPETAGTSRNRVIFEGAGGISAIVAPLKASATELHTLVPVLATDPWGAAYQGTVRVCVESDGHARACAPTPLGVRSPEAPAVPPGEVLVDLLQRSEQALSALASDLGLSQQLPDVQSMYRTATADLRRKIEAATAGSPETFEITLPDGSKQLITLDLDTIRRIEALLAASRPYLHDVLTPANREGRARSSAAQVGGLNDLATQDYEVLRNLIAVRDARSQVEKVAVAIAAAQLGIAGTTLMACMLAPPACFALAAVLPKLAAMFAILEFAHIAALLRIDLHPNAMAHIDTVPRGSIQVQPWSVNPLVVRARFVPVIDLTAGLERATASVVSKIIVASLPYGVVTSYIFEQVLKPFVDVIVQALVKMGLIEHVRGPIPWSAGRDVVLSPGVGPASVLGGGCWDSQGRFSPFGSAPGLLPFWVNHHLSALYGYEPMWSAGRCEFIATEALLWAGTARPVTVVNIQVMPLRSDRPGCASFPERKLRPFQRVYYVSRTNASGDRLVVGSPSTAQLFTVIIADDIGGRVELPLPRSPNERYCAPVELAPGCVADAYVPTEPEREGRFPSFEGILVDPISGLPFPGGIIPRGRQGSGGVHGWRVRSIQGCGG
ncbi:MAG: hypothetical protein RMK57_06370 [Bryobacterales bacterium]|nr:hypothetical protein [Bryobacterales bacterium]